MIVAAVGFGHAKKSQTQLELREEKALSTIRDAVHHRVDSYVSDLTVLTGIQSLKRLLDEGLDYEKERLIRDFDLFLDGKPQYHAIKYIYRSGMIVAHLERRRTIAEYVRIKSRIFMNHGPNDA